MVELLHKEKNRKELLCNPVQLILIVLLIIQFVGIMYSNFAFAKENIDCDSAKLFVHAIEMAKNRTYLVPDWSYITTLELDCATLLAVPIFALCGDIYVAFSVANGILLLLLIWVIFYLFRGKEPVYPLLASLFILIPYRIGQLDYFNMMFFNGSQYIVKVMLPLMLLGILLQKTEREKSKCTWKDILFVVIYFVLLFSTGFSSGIYLLLCGIFPIIMALAIRKFYNQERIPMAFWIWSGLSVGVNLVGIALNVLLKIGAKGNSMTLCSVYEWRDNISACFLGIFELFGGVSYEEVEALSYAGINTLLRMFFVMLLLGCCIYTLVKVLKHEADALSAGLVGVFVWNTFILCVCDIRYGVPTFEYRYHLVGMIPAMCLLAKTIWESYYVRKNGKIVLFLGTLIMLLTLNVTSYKAVAESENDYSELQEICDYANEVGAGYVYFLYESIPPEICRLLDYENAVYLQAMEYGSCVYDYYEYYNEAPIFDEDILLISNNNIYDYGEGMEMYGRNFRRYQIIGDRSIYR